MKIMKTLDMRKQIEKYRGLLVIAVAVLAILFPILITYAEGQKEYVFSKTEDSIYKTLIDHGYSTAGACGILGNISVENPKFQPDLYANGGITYGLFQWTDVGNRKSFLVKWCNNRLLYPNRVEGQLAYAMYELEGGDAQASRANDYLKTAKDPELAAMEFAVGFERCIGATSDKEADGIYDGVIYPERKGCTYQALTKRMKNAKKYYEAYYVAEPEEELSLKVKGTPTAGIVAEKEDKMEENLLEKVQVENESRQAVLWGYRVLCVIVGYLFGCILGVSVIIRNLRDRKKLHMDNNLPSLLTVLKHIGIKETILATVIDIGKFYLALLVVYLITKGALRSEQILWTGLGVILGNAYPFWHRFKGGMGIIVTTVFLCTYMPIWGYECCLLGLIVALISRSFPFGALSITFFAVPYGFFCKGPEAGIFITIALFILMSRHYKFLLRFVDKKVLHNYYRFGGRKERTKILKEMRT